MRKSVWGGAVAAALVFLPGIVLAQPRAEAGAPVAKALRVAVQEVVVGTDVDARVGQAISTALLDEVRKRRGISAIGMLEIRDMLSFEAQRQLMGCEASSECLAEIGGALGVDEIVTGTVTRVGESRVMTVTRMDIQRARVVSTFNQRLAAGDGEELFAAIGPAVARLYGDHPLREGRTAGVSEALVATLHPPPLPKWVFWTTTGLAGAAALTSGYFGQGFLTAQTQLDALRTRSVTTVVDGRQVVEAQDLVRVRADRTNLALAVTGGLVLVGVIEAFLTDWSDAAHAFDDTGRGPVARVEVGPAGLRVALW